MQQMAAVREKPLGLDVRILDFSTDISTFYLGSDTGSDILANHGHLSDVLHRGQHLSDRRSPKVAHLVSPYTWSPMRKGIIMAIACVATVFASVAASAYAPGETQMSAKWDLSQVAVATGITAFTTGFALAPMAIAPVSEVRGRRPVFLVMGVLYVICTICCAATESFGGYVPSYCHQPIIPLRLGNWEVCFTDVVL